MGLKESIENLMNYPIPLIELPKSVEISTELTDDEKDKPLDQQRIFDEKPENNFPIAPVGEHVKSAKNSKPKTEKKSYKKTIKEKYKKPLRRGDKIQNKKKKNKKR